MCHQAGVVADGEEEGEVNLEVKVEEEGLDEGEQGEVDLDLKGEQGEGHEKVADAVVVGQGEADAEERNKCIL